MLTNVAANPSCQGEAIPRLAAGPSPCFSASAITSSPAISGGYRNNISIWKDKRPDGSSNPAIDGGQCLQGAQRGRPRSKSVPASRVQVEVLFDSELGLRLGVVVDDVRVTCEED